MVKINQIEILMLMIYNRIYMYMLIIANIVRMMCFVDSYLEAFLGISWKFFKYYINYNMIYVLNIYMYVYMYMKICLYIIIKVNYKFIKHRKK
jgi:hypothetical protein